MLILLRASPNPIILRKLFPFDVHPEQDASIKPKSYLRRDHRPLRYLEINHQQKCEIPSQLSIQIRKITLCIEDLAQHAKCQDQEAQFLQQLQRFFRGCGHQLQGLLRGITWKIDRKRVIVYWLLWVINIMIYCKQARSFLSFLLSNIYFRLWLPASKATNEVVFLVLGHSFIQVLFCVLCLHVFLLSIHHDVSLLSRSVFVLGRFLF